MTKFNRFYVFLLFIFLFAAYTPVTQADMQQGYGYQADETRAYSSVSSEDDSQLQSYGRKVGNKALIALANLTTSILELPKNIINTMNESNIIYAITGGLFKGMINIIGRSAVGIADFVTIPIPTQPIAQPAYVWDNFDVDTTYGDVFRLDKTQPVEQPVTQTPVAQPVQATVAPPKTAAATPTKTAAVDSLSQYYQEINRKLNMLFDREMRK